MSPSRTDRRGLLRRRVDACLIEGPMTFEELFRRIEPFINHAQALREREYHLGWIERHQGTGGGRRVRSLDECVKIGRRRLLYYILRSSNKMIQKMPDGRYCLRAQVDNRVTEA